MRAAKHEVCWLPCFNSVCHNIDVCVCVCVCVCACVCVSGHMYVSVCVLLGSTRMIHLLAKEESNITNLKDYYYFFYIYFMLEYG